jgi:hypothetical protein
MARWTATDFVDISRKMCGGETTETLTDATFLSFVNRSYLDICTRNAVPELQDDLTITTSSGTATYEVAESAGTPLRIINIEHVVDTTNQLELYPISETQYHAYTQGSTSDTGTPIYWYISGTMGTAAPANQAMTFYPSLDGTYSVVVHYRKVPTELVLSPTATSTVISEAWDQVILHYAVYWGWMYLGDPQKALMFRKLAQSMEKDAKETSIYSSYEPWYCGSVVGAESAT